jgi:Xaa-Pro dipeptidase
MATGFQSVKTEEENAMNRTATKILNSMTGDIMPITLTERNDRVAKAQRLLSQNKMQALVLESGTALEYFTGISWWPSERTMVAVIPANG